MNSDKNESTPVKEAPPLQPDTYDSDSSGFRPFLKSHTTAFPAYIALASAVLFVLALIVRIIGLLNSNTPQPLNDLCYYASYGGYVLLPVLLASALAATGLLALIFKKREPLKAVGNLTPLKILGLAIIVYFVLPILFGFITWFFRGGFDGSGDNCWYDRENHLEELRSQEQFR